MSNSLIITRRQGKGTQSCTITETSRIIVRSPLDGTDDVLPTFTIKTSDGKVTEGLQKESAIFIAECLTGNFKS